MSSVSDCDLGNQTHTKTDRTPVVVRGHLLHNLTVDLVLQSYMLSGWTKDLVSQV